MGRLAHQGAQLVQREREWGRDRERDRERQGEKNEDGQVTNSRSPEIWAGHSRDIIEREDRDREGERVTERYNSIVTTI